MSVKANIETEKADIDMLKANIENMFNAKTGNHIIMLLNAFSNEIVFGRSDIMNITGLKPTRASELLKEMLAHGIIEQVTGYGKGKYKFRQR